MIVGRGNSGHDIAQNSQENDVDVTMIQRRGTYVFSAKTGRFMLYKDLYDECGPPKEDADVYGQTLPLPVRFALNVDRTSQIATAEKDSLDGLGEAGSKVDLVRMAAAFFASTLPAVAATTSTSMFTIHYRW